MCMCGAEYHEQFVFFFFFDARVVYNQSFMSCHAYNVDQHYARTPI